jgi:hypothetical protein
MCKAPNLESKNVSSTYLEPIDFLLWRINRYQDTTMTTPNQSVQLPIEECEEWIWDTLDCTKDCGFEYIKDDIREFLLFNTNDFVADAEALEKYLDTTSKEISITPSKGALQIYPVSEQTIKQ